jgi:hypothetical protein
MQIHIARNGQKMGPFSLEEVNRQLAAGILSVSDLAWYEGAAGWAALSTVPGISAGAPTAVPSAAPPAAAIGTAPAVIASTSGPMPPAASVPAPPKTEPLAILSLIFSVLGLSGFCCGFFLMMAIAGVVCGHLALSKIKKNPALQGHGLALSGVIIGYAAIGGWLIWVFLFGGLAALQSISESMKSKP